jgi:hypothetical protein
MRDGGRVVLAVLILFVRTEISVTTFDTNHSVTDSTQSIAASVLSLTDCVVNSVSISRHRQSTCQAKLLGV